MEAIFARQQVERQLSVASPPAANMQRVPSRCASEAAGGRGQSWGARGGTESQQRARLRETSCAGAARSGAQTLRRLSQGGARQGKSPGYARTEAASASA